jgi:hypothetical protein
MMSSFSSSLVFFCLVLVLFTASAQQDDGAGAEGDRAPEATTAGRPQSVGRHRRPHSTKAPSSDDVDEATKSSDDDDDDKDSLVLYEAVFVKKTYII